MAFEPAVIRVRTRETLRFEITNSGLLEYEFMIDTRDAIIEREVAMQAPQDMEHAAQNVLRLEPRQSRKIVWKFTSAGSFEFACLVPGHYDLGMKGKLEVKP